jgi:hypothetical protein
MSRVSVVAPLTVTLPSEPSPKKTAAAPPDPAPAAASGPTVAPATRTKRPELVVQRSPLLGLVGAAPCGRLIPAPAAADPCVCSSALTVRVAEKLLAPDQVLAPLSNGTFAPLVPVFWVAAVPSPRLLRAAEALPRSERLLARKA